MFEIQRENQVSSFKTEFMGVMVKGKCLGIRNRGDIKGGKENKRNEIKSKGMKVNRAQGGGRYYFY